MDDWVFYVLALGLVSSSLMVALSSYPVRAVLALIGCFVTTSVLWLTLGAEFLALALIFVYVGAVMALFLFIVFMLNVDRLKSDFSRMQQTLYFFVGMGFVLMLIYKASHWITPHPQPESFSNQSNTEAIGILLFRDYWLAFEYMGFILLSAMIGAVALVSRINKDAKSQDISQQLAADAQSRIKKVDL